MSKGFDSRQHQPRSKKYQTTAFTPSHDDLLQRAINNPNRTTLTPEVVTSLQQTHGNKFVLRLLDESRAKQNPQLTKTSEPNSIQRIETATLIQSGLGVGGGAILGQFISWLTGVPAYISAPLFGILGGVAANMLGDSEDSGSDKFEESRKDRLGANSFRTSAGLEVYGKALHKGFNDFLNTLKEDDSWMDGGAGEARAMYDYYESEGEAKLTAINYKLPKNKALINEMLESSEIDFSSLEGDFEALFDEKQVKIGSYKLITDNNGILMYSKHLDQDLLKYIRLLKPGGRLYASNSDMRIFDNVEEFEEFEKLPMSKKVPKPYLAFNKWLREIQGVDIISDNPITLERNDDEIDVPPLELLYYDAQVRPPTRAYARE